MRFTCSFSDLSSALTIANRAISKVQNTITDCVLLEASREGVLLKATDKSTYVRVPLEANVEEPGMAATPSRLLYDFVNHLPNADVTVKRISDSSLEVSSLSASGRLTLADASIFPQFPEMTAVNTFRIAADQLATMITGTVFSAASTDDRPVLTGVLFDVHKDKLLLVGIDGFRMAIREDVIQAQEEGQYIVPARALREISRTIENADGDIEVHFEQGKALFETPKAEYIVQLINGEFMPYASLFPDSFATHMQIDTQAFREGIERAVIMAGDGENSVVHFNMSSDVLELSGDSRSGSSQEPIPVVLHGSDLKIALRGRYVLDVLKVVDEEEIMMRFNTPISACAIERDGLQAYRYLILPVQIHSNQY